MEEHEFVKVRNWVLSPNLVHEAFLDDVDQTLAMSHIRLYCTFFFPSISLRWFPYRTFGTWLSYVFCQSFQYVLPSLMHHVTCAIESMESTTFFQEHWKQWSFNPWIERSSRTFWQVLSILVVERWSSHGYHSRAGSLVCRVLTLLILQCQRSALCEWWVLLLCGKWWHQLWWWSLLEHCCHWGLTWYFRFSGCCFLKKIKRIWKIDDCRNLPFNGRARQNVKVRLLKRKWVGVTTNVYLRKTDNC